MKKVLKAVKAVGLKTAKNSVNSASFFYMHQEPPMQEDRSAGVAFVINIQNEW